MKIFSVSALLFSTMLVLGWPLVLFMSGFLFDAPDHGNTETKTWVVEYVILTYPVGYFVAIGYFIFASAKREKVPWWAPPTGFLFLVPIAHFCVALWAGSRVMG